MNALQPLSQSETASLSERVYRRLRDAIAMGSLAPRTRVSERGLAARLGAEANTRFHEMIRAMAGNAMLETTLRSLRGYDQVGRQRSLAAPGEFTRALVEHTELLDALRLGDQDRAELLMRAHGLRSLRQASQHPAPPQAVPALNEDGLADGLAPAGPDGSSQNGPDHNRRTT
ncbi:MAG: FCD domain-containing protein [Roseomonas mucosa]|nr:FCD domain-containing protein [Roseomonas mucosa]